MTGPSMHTHLLTALECAQGDVEEQYSDTESEEEIEDAPLQDS
jgi:hypothetical protein